MCFSSLPSLSFSLPPSPSSCRPSLSPVTVCLKVSLGQIYLSTPLQCTVCIHIMSCWMLSITVLIDVAAAVCCCCMDSYYNKVLIDTVVIKYCMLYRLFVTCCLLPCCLFCLVTGRLRTNSTETLTSYS